MDLVQLRESGELSDIRVVIDGEEHNLHKFPLYIKSNYFKQLAENISANADENTVELEEFPGGRDTFNVVADFCYNKRIDITLENVVRLRCASEFMEMHGPGNLVELTERYLNDILTSARLSRSLSSVIDLLTECSNLGEISEKAGVAEKCFKAIVEIWMKPSSMFSSPRKSGFYGESEHITDKLLQLSLEWFVKLIGACKENETRLKPLADLVSSYLSRVFECEAAESSDPPVKDEKPPKAPRSPKKGKSGGKARKEVNGKRDSDADSSDSDREKDEKPQEKEGEEVAEGEAIEDDDEEESELAAIESERACLPKLPDTAGNILDAVINELPESTPLAEVIDVEWIRRAIEISEKYECQCRERLLQLAGNILHRFTNEELKEIPSSVLCDIIENTIRNEKIVPEVLTCVLDNYLHDLARKGELAPEDFIKLVKSVSGDYRSNHDTLYEVLEQLLSPGDVDEETKVLMLDVVDLTRCNERTLQKALDSGVVPAKKVCQAAIKLAAKLRNEADQPIKPFKRTVPNPTMRDAIKTPSKYDQERHRYDAPSYGDRVPSSYMSPSNYHAYSVPVSSDLDYSMGSSYPYHSPYSSSYSSSPMRSKVRMEDTTMLEDNLRTELHRISSSYDQYFRDRAHRAAREPIGNRYNSTLKGSTRRW